MEEAWQEMCDGLRHDIACLQEERQTWQEQRAHWESEMAAYHDALATLARQFDEFQQDRQREGDWESERAAYQDALADLAGQLDELQHGRQQEHDWEPEMAGYQDALAHLARQFDEFQQERQREHDWESERAGCQDALAGLAKQFDEFQQDRQREHDAWVEQLQQLQALVEAAASARHEQPVADAGLFGEETEDPSDHGDQMLPNDDRQDARLGRFLYDEPETPESEEDPGQETESPWLEDRSSLLPQPDFAAEAFRADDGSDEDSAGMMRAEDECAPDASYVTEEYDQGDALDEDEGEDSAVTPTPDWLAQYQEQQDDSDSSISDYMNRLLQRVGGSDETPSFGDERGVEAPATASENASSSETASQPPETEAEPAEHAALPQPEPSPYPAEKGDEGNAPRNTAPERGSNIAAMRELANASARNAIHTCDKKRTAKSAMGRIPLLLVELVCGGTLLYWAIHSGQAVAYAGAAVCFIAAAMTGMHTLFLFLRTALAALRMPEFRETAEPAHADEGA